MLNMEFYMLCRIKGNKFVKIDHVSKASQALWSKCFINETNNLTFLILQS